MKSRLVTAPRDHQVVIARFVAACTAEDRVVAALLGGSYARGAADAYSDLDLALIATDESYESLWADRGLLIGQLGETLFLEDFGGRTAFFVLADGTEGELSFGRQSRFREVHGGPFKPLVDKTGILAGATFPWQEPDRDEQDEALRRVLSWFWHDLSHFVAAAGRGQLWWAQGQLEALRGQCLNLVRLANDVPAQDEPYEKVDLVVPAAALAALGPTVRPMEARAMLDAAAILVDLHRELGPPVAREHGVDYPRQLERLISARLQATIEAVQRVAGDSGDEGASA